MSITKLVSGQITISTPRLLLRGAIKSDAGPLFKAFRDPEVMRYWSELPHPSILRTDEWISNTIAAPSNGITDFILCLKPDNTPIGKMGVWQGEEIGFLLVRDQWGRGLAREALNALLPHLYGSVESGGTGLEKIVADVDPRNAASIGFLKSFGFVEIGFEEKTFEIDGKWVDSTYLELRRENWKG